MNHAGPVYRLHVWILAVLLAATVFAWRYLSFEEYGNDHFVHLSQAQQMVRGALPVRDFAERGLPLMTAASAAAQLGWGEGLRAEVLLVDGAYALAAGVLFIVVAAVTPSTWIALLSTLPTVVIFPIGYSYPKLLLYAAALAMARRYARRATWSRACEWGLLVGAGFLFRHDHGVLLIMAAVLLMVVCHGATRAGALALGRVCLVSLLLVSPFLIWVQVYQGLGAYLVQELAFARREAERREGWWIPPAFALDRDRPLWTPLVGRPIVALQWRRGLAPAAVDMGERRHGLTRVSPAGPDAWHYELPRWDRGALEILVHDPEVASTDGIDRTTFTLAVPHPSGLRAALTHVMIPGYGLRLRGNGVGVWFYLIWTLPFASMLVLGWQWRRLEPATRAVAIVAIGLQLAMNVAFIRDPLPTRIRDVLVPSAALLAFIAAPVWLAFSGPLARATARAAVSVALVCLVLLSGAVGEASERLETTRVLEGVTAIRERMRELRRVVLAQRARHGRLDEEHRPIVEYLQRCTSPDSRFLTLTFAPELFFYTGHLFAGGQVAMIPGYFASEADQQLMVRRLMREDVPIVLLDSETRDTLAQDYPRLMAWVAPRYREAGRFRAGSDRELIVLAETARSAPGRFDSTSLPCFVP